MALFFAFAVGLVAVAAGWAPARRLWQGASRGEVAALAGALALAAAAYIIMALGWMGHLRTGFGVAAVVLAGSSAWGARVWWPELRGSSRQVSWGWAAVFAPFLAVAVVSAMAPPLAMEWDSLAYHLALPKIWLHLNAAPAMPYDHHSYFPQLMEMLYATGLAVAGYGAAKLMHTLMAVLTVLAVAGFAARYAGRGAGRWAVLAIAGCPLALWEAGTAYVDISTALYTVLALLMLFDARITPPTPALPPAGGGSAQNLGGGAPDAGIGVRTQAEACGYQTSLILGAAVCAGLTAATKYNGLLTVLLLAGTAVVWVGAKGGRDGGDGGGEGGRGGGTSRWGEWLRGLGWKPAAVIVVVGLVVAAPWYLRNLVDTGNPVYPFAYEVFGGRYWSRANAVAYRGEQEGFGVGRQPLEMLRAPWDLTTQPERFVNLGQAWPQGSLGFALLLCPVLLALRRKKPAAFWLVVGFSAANIVCWFWLSQQARYILALAPAWAVLCGMAAGLDAAIVRNWARVAIAAQAVFTLALFVAFFTLDQAPVAFQQPGSEAVQEYLWERCAQFSAAAAINQLPPDSKIALYDDVLGFYYDRKYVWANPGHSTLIPYDQISTGPGLVYVLRQKGFTDVLVNLTFLPPALREKWRPMLDEGAPFDGPLPEGTEAWRREIAEAVQRGLLVPESVNPRNGYRLYRIVTIAALGPSAFGSNGG